LQLKKNKTSRIAFFLPAPNAMTGAPRRLLTLMTALRDSGRFEVALIADPSDQLAQEAGIVGIKVLEVTIGPILSKKHGILLTGSIGFRGRVVWELMRYNFRMIRAFCVYKPDVIWIRGSKGIAFVGLAAFMIHRPLVWDIDSELPSRGLVAILHDFGLWMSSKVVLQYAAADERIFGIDRVQRTRQKFEPMIPGIDFEQLLPYRERRFLQCTNKAFVYGFFRILQGGSICDIKNQRFTLRVLSELKRSFPHLDFELWIAGDEYEEDYTETVKRDLESSSIKKNVKFLGWRDDIPELLVRADLLIHPSKDEGVPNIIQEAMYMGCPVLASDVGGVPEIVENNRTGWILPNDDPAVWAEKIAWIISNPKKVLEIANAAAFYAEQNFSVDQWAARYAEILELR